MSKGPYDPMDMKALLCFETMAKHGSLTRASIELGIADAAVSQRIKSLEKYLGTKLYEARGGKVRLTEAGHRTTALPSSYLGYVRSNQWLHVSRFRCCRNCCFAR